MLLSLHVLKFFHLYLPFNPYTLHVACLTPSASAVAVCIWINWCMLSFAVSARWNEAWPFGPSTDAQVYPPLTATQASDKQTARAKRKKQKCRYWRGGNLSECGLFISLRASSARIWPCSQRWCGFGDLHLIMNSKDDLFSPALHLKELRSDLATGSGAITGVSRWKIATIFASTSSKLLQAFGGNKSTDHCASIRRPPRSKNHPVLLFKTNRNTFSPHSWRVAFPTTSSWCSDPTTTIKCTHRQKKH